VKLWDRYLENIEREYRDHPDDYLRQPTISKCLHPGRHWSFNGYYEELKKDRQFGDVLASIVEGEAGLPLTLFDGLSAVTVQHVYQLYMIDRHIGVSVINNDISHLIDIGGGYGNLCKIARELGYIGRYTIADFPLMREIQKDYLGSNDIFDVEFVPLDMDRISPQKKSMLIATYSISEMPLETRRQLEPHYKSFDYLFFVYNPSFDGVDNIEYFSNLKDTLKSNFGVVHVPDIHIQRWSNHHIMMCKTQ
jgi:hypothetical protein